VDNNKKQFLKSLEEAYGIISTACNNQHISRQTFYNWKKDDPEFAEAVEDINQAAIDHVESKLMEKVNGVTIGKYDNEGELSTYELPPSDTAIIFFLKCKAKKRGYVERTELDVSGALGITWHEERTYEKPGPTETKDIDRPNTNVEISL
jgi:hypothetical protein